MTSSPEITRNGTKRWRNSEGGLHRLDGPAVEWADGSTSWWVGGKLHRLDGPAVERVDGYKAWWVEGKEMTEEGFNSLIKTTSREVYVSPFTGKLV